MSSYLQHVRNIPHKAFCSWNHPQLRTFSSFTFLCTFAPSQVSDANKRNTTWKINNRLYGPSSVSFADEFVKSSKKHYNYDHSKINFRDKRSTVNSINEWAAKSTDGKLPEVTKEVQNPEGAMIVNAMFFKRECE